MTFRIPTDALRHIASLLTYGEESFCPFLLQTDIWPGSAEDPDGPPFRASIPCSLPKGHEGGHRFPMPERKVSR